jgi:hypothetical protein
MKVDYPWLPSYEAAILETDRSKLPNLVKTAEQAITSRMQVLSSDHGGTEDERMAIRDAMSGLNILRNEVSDGSLGGDPTITSMNKSVPNKPSGE